MNKATLWNDLKLLLSTTTVTITRQFLLKSLYRHSPTTIDTYRMMLTTAGFLKNVGVGKYQLIEQIPMNLTINQCQELAYNTVNFSEIKV